MKKIGSLSSVKAFGGSKNKSNILTDGKWYRLKEISFRLPLKELNRVMPKTLLVCFAVNLKSPYFRLNDIKTLKI